MGCTCNAMVSDSKTPEIERPLIRLRIPLSKEIRSMVAYDSNQIILGGINELQLLDISTKSIKTLSSEHDGIINFIIKLSNGNIASAGQDKTIRIWDISDSQSLFILRGHSSMIWCLYELKNGELVSGADDKKIKIWDLKNQKENFTLYEGKRETSSIVQLKNENILATSGKSVLEFDYYNKIQKNELNLNSSAWCMKLLENGLVCVGLGNGEIAVLSSDQGGLGIKYKFQNGHKKSVNSIIEYKRNYIISASDENILIIWKIDDNDREKYLINEHKNNISSIVALSGNKFASASKDNIIFWE